MSKTSRSVSPLLHGANVVRELHLADVSVLQLEGPLHAPLGAEVRRRVEALLTRGEAEIVLCLARVPTVDAAGVGELVRAHTKAAAMDRLLRITNTTARVRTLFDRLGLFGLLSVGRTPPRA